MASPTPKRAPTPRQHPPRPPASPSEIIDPRWLLKAIALVIVAAIVCAWLTLCLLVYQGQWQLLLHPDQNPKLTTTLPATPVRFGATETGQPRLAGLWLPADNTPIATILYLPDGNGRLADDLPTLAQLHQLPLNVFAFDYRGFGASDFSQHPTQARMAEDATAALDYLLTTRHIPALTIIPYGAGLGASLATALAAAHPDLPALILESPIPNPTAFALQDSRANFVPLHLFFHERFEIAPTLTTLKTPKLLLTTGPSHVAHPPNLTAIDTLYKSAQTPSFTAHLTPWNPANEAASTGPTRAYRETILRFLHEYIASPPTALRPLP